MRILKVRFKNLDSLLGEWVIDFTDPAYVSNGIFAITGPADAGKDIFAALTDAICLALYARSPRPQASAVMPPGAGECLAEVLFEHEAKHEAKQEAALGAKPEQTKQIKQTKYLALWEQHRSHRKPEGAVQPLLHEIREARPKDETNRQSGAPALKTLKIQEITGLTFEQFIVGLLPPQDDFSAFLQGGPDDRSAILERITGTEIYAQIPARVQEAHNTERVSLSLLEAEMAALKNLDTEDRKTLEAKLAALVRDEAEADENLERRSSEYQWLSNMDAVQKDLDMLEDRRQDLARRQEGFEPERKRLERARQALELGTAHAALAILRKEQEAEKRKLFECQTTMPELETGVRRSEEALQIAVSAHSERQTEQKNLLDLLTKVRELDLQHKEKDAPIEEAQADAARLTEASEKLKARLDEERSAFEKTQINLRDVRKFLQDRAVDEKLIEVLPGIQTRFGVLGAAIDKKRRLSADFGAAEKQKQEAHDVLNGQSVLHETTKAKFTSLENSIRKQKGSLDEMLAARTIRDLKESLTDALSRKARQRQIEETLIQRQETAAALQRLKVRLEALNSSRLGCLEKIAKQKAAAGDAEKETLRMEGQQELLRRIKDMNEARGRLREGEPCPLCGSAAHPYVLGGIPSEDEISSALLQARENLEKQLETLSSLQLENQRLDEESLQTAEEETRFHSQLQALESQLTDRLAELQLVLPMDADPLTAIGQQQQKTEETLQKTRLAIERAEKIEEELSLAREELERLRQDREQLARSRQEAEFGKETASRELDRLAKEIRLHDEESKNIRLDLIHHTAIFGVKHLPDDQPEQVLELLEERCRKWREHHQLRTSLEKQISVGERELHGQRSALDGINLEIKHKNETIRKLRAEKDALRQQRVSLFGEKDADAEEAARAALTEAARQQEDAKRGAREAALLEFSLMHSRMEELGKSIHIRAGELHKAELSFKKRLLSHDFASEDSYLSACLSEAERKTLLQRAQALSSEKAELDASQTDKQFEIEELRRRHLTEPPLTEVPPEDALERVNEAAALLKELRQSIEALHLRLEDEETFRQKREERAAAVEKQSKECRRWEAMRGIAASADLRKNHGAAQYLTLEMLIRHANRQLQKMTGRYSLALSGQELLEVQLPVIEPSAHRLSLSVTENFAAAAASAAGQADRRLKNAKNLSGVENFIISLAMALGFSQMTGPNARVDLLILESAGALDALDNDGLNTALSALASLRLEGRLVGVISGSNRHARILKERAVQIELVPQSGGQ